MYIFHLFCSFRHCTIPIGSRERFLAAALALSPALFALVWRPFLQPYAVRFAARRLVHALSRFRRPPRSLLLPHHPSPAPGAGRIQPPACCGHASSLSPGRSTASSQRVLRNAVRPAAPTDSSIYPIGQGIALALRRILFGRRWAVVISTSASAHCATGCCERGSRRERALAGGLAGRHAIGSLNPWMNSYWAEPSLAAGGVLVFGSLPEMQCETSKRAMVYFSELD